MQPSRATTTSRVPLASGLTREYLLHHGVCPQEFTPDTRELIVAAEPDALIEACTDELRSAYGSPISFLTIPRPELEGRIERLCAGSATDVELSSVDDEWAAQGADGEVAADVRDLASQPPVVRYVNLLVRDAYDAGASDVHLEATRTGLEARFRLDGVLAPAPEPPAALAQAIVSRVKLLAELDIAERRRPQDGRIRVRLAARELDLRVSTVPTVFGESVVLRLLDRGGRPVELEELGMPPSLLAGMSQLSRRPHGLVLVTGPTGSGKTTTLYACLRQRDSSVEKIITVEEPVEYEFPGVTQVPVHGRSGVSFAGALRSILRHDPDVVMVGETRDSETAEVAIQAAMTGHLVFSTLHTNDSIGAVPRLLDLGVPPYLVAATLEGVLAQRLVRRICDSCRVPSNPPEEALQQLASGGIRSGGNSLFALPKLTRGAGCPSCRGTGFNGRVGIYELLVVTDDLKDAITRGAGRRELREVALQNGLVELRSDGWEKVCAGITTVEEVLRVVKS